MLIHVGIDTVQLDGKGFEVFVNDGDKIKKGDILIKFDIDYLIENAPSLATPIVFTNLVDSTLNGIQFGKVVAGEEILTVE